MRPVKSPELSEHSQTTNEDTFSGAKTSNPPSLGGAIRAAISGTAVVMPVRATGAIAFAVMP
jgi:hypothetical protein